MDDNVKILNYDNNLSERTGSISGKHFRETQHTTASHIVIVFFVNEFTAESCISLILPFAELVSFQIISLSSETY